MKEVVAAEDDTFRGTSVYNMITSEHNDSSHILHNICKNIQTLQTCTQGVLSGSNVYPILGAHRHVGAIQYACLLFFVYT